MPDKVVSAQRVPVPGREALCMTLRCLAYPNRLADLEMMFNRHLSVISSVVNQVLAHVEYHFGHLLYDLTTHTWLNLDSLERFSEVRIYVAYKRGAHIKKKPRSANRNKHYNYIAVCGITVERCIHKKYSAHTNKTALFNLHLDSFYNAFTNPKCQRRS
ncbi:hypothetical protein HPB48_000769 [Haemaphysalis longicornis]|uniref:Uncharacterized protein n=1 Tax=Haemaphysalis longicornis TaxID=44386 RepID=A0A9J6G9W1_HAELO|nr:hypothetical protein HPB48_000769 [Haemaphysalis longicornis]